MSYLHQGGLWVCEGLHYGGGGYVGPYLEAGFEIARLWKEV